MTHWAQAHQVLATIVACILASNVASNLPKPDANSGKFYRFVYGFVYSTLNDLLFFAKQKGVVIPSAAGAAAGSLMLCGLMLLTGCAVKNQTPQYNAAVGINDLAHAITAFQQAEIATHTAGFISDADHVAIEKDIKQAFDVDALAETATKSGDLTTARSKYQAVLVILENLDPKLVGVKNSDSEAILAAALKAAVSIAQDWAGSAQ